MKATTKFFLQFYSPLRSNVENPAASKIAQYDSTFETLEAGSICQSMGGGNIYHISSSFILLIALLTEMSMNLRKV
ncbi:hypothetical protein ACTXT7_005754 [Hymenolepis weldensis]